MSLEEFFGLSGAEVHKAYVDGGVDLHAADLTNAERGRPDDGERVPVVHQLIELDKSLVFVLTGSSARKLRRTGVDLLAGRAVLTTMHPFLAAELRDSFDLDQALTLGTLPLIVDAETLTTPSAPMRRCTCARRCRPRGWSATWVVSPAFWMR